MAQTDFEVVGVVRGRDLDGARPELGIDVLVCHDGDLPIGQGKKERLSDESGIARIAGMHRDRRIAEHGLGAGGRNDDFLAAALDGIGKIPEMPVFFRVLDLRIGKRRLTARTPVDDAVSAIDEPLVIKAEKSLVHGAGAFLVHCERKARPIAGRAELFELLDNPAAVLFLPRPGAAQELLSADLLLAHALFFHLFDDLDLGRDRGVVSPGKPERTISLHPFEAGEDILHGLVHRMPHVQLPCDVGRRHHDGKRHLRGIDLRAEAALVRPLAIDPLFKILGIVRRLHLFHVCLCPEKNVFAPFLPNKKRIFMPF